MSLEDIAIVGQSVRLPGEIRTVASLWQALIDKRKDLMVPVPEDRWDHASFYRPPGSSSPPQPGDISFAKAGFIDVATYDNAFFGLTSAEAMHIAPNIRLTLEAAFEALEDANIPTSRIKGTDTGVFVATGLDEGYFNLIYADQGYGAYSRFYGTGTANSTACGRLSYVLDLHGPSVSIDTACSGGLVALNDAVKYLRYSGGECAIVAGVNTHVWPGNLSFLTAHRMCSPNGRCATFTSEADGYAPSEAAVGIILKTRSAAERDGDSILGLIKATDTRHNGKTQGLVAPSMPAQVMLEKSLLRQAGLAPSDIDYVEAHGTGTSLGDSAEIQGITEVFRGSHSEACPLIIGAAKTCFGHTESASGLVGVVAAIQALNHRRVPGLNHLTSSNMSPKIDCSAVPMTLPTQPVRLPARKNPLRALVLGFGFAGTISGAVLESPPKSTGSISASQHATVSQHPMLFVVSAKTPAALDDYIQRYLDFCQENAHPADFQSICYTSCVGREHYRHRFACVVTNMDDLIGRLEERLSKKIPKNARSSSGIVLGFPGQGSQFVGMASGLARRYSGFRAVITEAATKAEEHTGFPVLAFLLDENVPIDRSIDESEIGQVCVFVYQYSFATWVTSLGLEPQAVIGHSLGEIAGSVIAGVLPFDIAVQFVIKRAQLLQPNPKHPGGMVAVAASENVVQRYIDDLGVGDLVVIAVHNGPESLVVSGDVEALGIFVSTVKSDGIRATKLNVDQGFHSPCINGALPELRAWLDANHPSGGYPKLPFFSTVFARQLVISEKISSDYWVKHAANPVKFFQTATKIATDGEYDVILDVGPQRTIWAALQTSHFKEKVIIPAAAKAAGDQESAFLTAVGTLFENSVDLDFVKLYAEHGLGYSKKSIPTYPFQRQRHYPSYIATRRTLLPSTELISSQPTKSLDTVVVNERFRLCLDDHLIEGRRVIPGATFVSYWARSQVNPTRSVKAIRFHQRLEPEDSDVTIVAHIERDGSFSMYRGASRKDEDKLASGTFAEATPQSYIKTVSVAPPSKIINQAEVYSSFGRNIALGPSFQNISEIRVWDDHADGMINMAYSPYPEWDYVRKLDACVHMFGGMNDLFFNTFERQYMNGAYLPNALEGFTMFVDALPDKFICRYHLPFARERNDNLFSTRFEVLSVDDGKLIALCEKYSVAWIPMDRSRPDTGVPSNTLWMQSSWLHNRIGDFQSGKPFESLVYLTDNPSLNVTHAFAPLASDFAYFVDLHKQEYIQAHASAMPNGNFSQSFSPVGADYAELLDRLTGQSVTILLDTTSTTLTAPEDPSFAPFWSHVLSVMKLMALGKIKFSNFIVLSSTSVPATMAPSDFTPETAQTPGTLGSIVQGMLRVFRREMGVDDNVWGLDLPIGLDVYEVAGIVGKEVAARSASKTKDAVVAYRRLIGDKPMVRLTPVWQRLTRAGKMLSMGGVTVIVGMGSIGCSLTPSLVEAGSGTVVFLGRRPSTDKTIASDLADLNLKSNGSRITYLQADASDLEALRATLQDIQLTHGPIKNIIHTAAVVDDMTITSITSNAFARVLKPKVEGAWNLHLLSLDLDLQLDHFIVLSSISVPLGNPGQVAYVGANTFLDKLAVYRRGLQLPGLSLQLGAWESKLTEGLSLETSGFDIMSNAEGIPLIMKALSMARSAPVQVVARLELEGVARVPVLAKDPMLAEALDPVRKKASSGSSKAKMDKEEVKQNVVGILRTVLEMKPSETLDLDESLSSSGIDSIFFAQVKSSILRDLGVDIPMTYLSDTYKIKDMIAYTCDQAA